MNNITFIRDDKLDSETYKERCAKLTFQSWLDDFYSNPFINIESTSTCFIDYPIVSEFVKINNEQYDYWLESRSDSIRELWWKISSFYATNECANIYQFITEDKKEDLPITVDIVLGNTKKPKYFIFLSTNKENIEKFRKILLNYSFDNENQKILITIEPDWILEQTNIPKKLEYKTYEVFK